MDSRVVAVGIALLVVLSGCTAVTDGGPLWDRWEGDPDNHWRSEAINVSYGGGEPDRAYAPLVRAAADYWTANSDRYAGYPVRLRVVDADGTADVHVRFVDRVGDCGTHDVDTTVGCAPILTEPGQVDRPVDVRVRTGFTNDSTVAVLKHELGHTLGLSHADEPRAVMRPESRLVTTPDTNATDRQVREALAYFDRGAGGTVPETVAFRRIDSREDADVVVTVTNESDCRAGTGSCGTVTGTDPDGDGALERYTRLEIVVVGLDTEAVGWHVGRWLGVGFGLEADAAFPPPLRENATYEDRRSEWWTDA